MRHTYLICSILLATAAASLVAQDQPAANRTPPPRAGLTLTSPSFSDGGVIPSMPKSPQLEWKGVLPNTVSFVLIVHDANTSLGGSADDVLHWMVFNIPASARELAAGLPIAGELPDGSIQGVNRGGEMDTGPWVEAGVVAREPLIISFSISTRSTPNFLWDRKPLAPKSSAR